MGSLVSTPPGQTRASTIPASTVFWHRINDDFQDVSDIQYRPMPRWAREPEQDVSQCLRDAMSISCFKGRTSRFIEEIISEGWKIAQDRIQCGILARHPDLTE